MITPLAPSSFVHLTEQVANRLQPSPWKPAHRRPGKKTYITVFSIITGLLLVGSLTDLPLAIQVLLVGTLGLVIYGVIAASFSQMRFWLLACLLALTGFNLLHSLAHFELGSHRQAMFWAQSASEEFHELLSNSDQYHLLGDELLISQDYWKKHSHQVKPFQND